MLIFNTMFPIATSADISDLLFLARDWWVSSPHSTISQQLNNEFKIAVDCCIQDSRQRFTSTALSSNGKELGGVRLKTKERDATWVTEVVGAKDDNFWVSVKVYCESESPQVENPTANKPYFFKLITKSIGMGFDGPVPTANRPIYFKDNDIDIAERIIRDTMGCLMPMVYISACSNNTHCVNAERIALKLYVMANVFVEPNEAFAINLSKSTKARIPPGNIGIYWPGTASVWEINPQNFATQRSIENEIYNMLTASLLAKSTKRECSWSHLQEAKTKHIIDELRTKESTEVEKYIAAFDSEKEVKDKEIKRLEEELSHLKAKIYQHPAPAPLGSSACTFEPEEIDFYLGEKNDIIYDVIEKILTTIPPSRRKDILLDHLRQNPLQGQREVIIKKLKSALKDYTRLDGKKKKALAEAGFSITEDGRHYKLIYHGDERYNVTLSKTGSDYRTGQNTIRDILHKVF
ncbi:MAG: hypothetical protein AB7E32_12755 [Desulfovibrio sp.]